MAERRMFAKTIIDSDSFLDMPISSQLLYFHLAMRADDDGFVNSPKKIMRVIGVNQDDLSILCLRKFIIPFDSGVVVIKHWRIHNYIRKDTYNETTYKKEKATLYVDENKAYTQQIESAVTTSQLSVDEPSTQVRLGKVSIGKVNNNNKEPVTLPEKNFSNTKNLTEEEYKKLFDGLAQKYPKKANLEQAYISYRKLVKNYSQANLVQNSAIRYVESTKDFKYLKKLQDFLQKDIVISYLPFVDPNCPKCKGKGVYESEDKNTMIRCNCWSKWRESAFSD